MTGKLPWISQTFPFITVELNQPLSGAGFLRATVHLGPGADLPEPAANVGG